LSSFPRLYRVFPWLEDADEGKPGNPLYVAAPQGRGRVDNPDRYLTLYASDEAPGAIAEAFGNNSTWTPDLLDGPPSLPGSRRALAVFDSDATRIVDLDDAQALLDRKLRPSRVVTRDRDTTQRWALRIFNERRWSGVRWWSYYNADWGSFGIWGRDFLETTDVIPLDSIVDLVRQTAADLNRVWEGAG
jgi:hypothetical protein